VRCAVICAAMLCLRSTFIYFYPFCTCTCTSFTTTTHITGGDITVTNENLPEYLDAQLQYRTMVRVNEQLAEFLKGMLMRVLCRVVLCCVVACCILAVRFSLFGNAVRCDLV